MDHHLALHLEREGQLVPLVRHLGAHLGELVTHRVLVGGDHGVRIGLLERLDPCLVQDVQASAGGRGVVGGEGTMADLEAETAYLEGIDVARARFRFTSLADQVEAVSKGRLLQGVIGAAGGVADFMDVRGQQRRIQEMESVAARKKRAKSKTVIQPRPTIRFGPRVGEDPMWLGPPTEGVA
jgi:hypothetical protein